MKPYIYNVLKSKDKITKKIQFIIENKYITDVVLVERPEKNIICFPCQIGCSMSCKFCNSGNYIKDLNPDQILYMINFVKDMIVNKQKVNLLSCMGEGEASLNKHIVDIFTILNASSDKLAVATTGIQPNFFEKMNQFKDNLKIMLSLHATTNKKRCNLLNIKSDVNSLIEEFKKYDGKKEINYVLLDNINDGIKDCAQLRKLCGRIPIKINRYNEVNNMFRISNKINNFMFIYKIMFGNIEYYETDGSDISASCGMMSYQIQ